jgi:hypothetical protein
MSEIVEIVSNLQLHNKLKRHDLADIHSGGLLKNYIPVYIHWHLDNREPAFDQLEKENNLFLKEK